MKRLITFPALCAAYLVAGIVTFGHAMNTLPKEQGMAPLFGSFVSSLGWPLYVSTQLWNLASVESVQSVSASPQVEGGGE